MNSKQRIVIVGATSVIAEQCARIWLQQGPAHLTLVGRNKDRIERVARDLQVRSLESEIVIQEAQFLEPDSIKAVSDRIFSAQAVDICLIAHGKLPNQNNCQNDLKLCYETLQVNGTSSVLFAEAFAKHMARANHGTITFIGSVAGDRGRKSNYVYGAAKGLVERYVQGLQHRFAGSKVKVVLVKPGPTDTPMTAKLKDQGRKLASTEQVAKQIVDATKRGKPVVYTPSQWWLIMKIVKHLPAFIFNKLNI